MLCDAVMGLIKENNLDKLCKKGQIICWKLVPVDVWKNTKIFPIWNKALLALLWIGLRSVPYVTQARAICLPVDIAKQNIQ
jgi:hypothetical protein